MPRRREKSGGKLKAADLILRVLLSELAAQGLANIDPHTQEFRFKGLRYSIHGYDWMALVGVIGRDALEAALKDGGAA